MKTNKTNDVKAFNASVKNAKGTIKELVQSPYYLTNLYNKIAKGTLSQIDGLDVDNTDVKAVAKVLKGMHGGRYAFDLNVFARDSYGRICLPTTAKRCPRYGLDLISVGPKGWQYLRPVKCTAAGLFAAYCAVAKVDVKAKADAEKDAAREAKAAAKAAKELEKARRTVMAVFGDLANSFTDADILDKAKAIKSAK